MTRTEIEQLIKDLNSLVMKGKLMDTFETYYHDDVVMQENNMAPTVSKEANRQRALQFLQNVTDFRSAEVKSAGVGDNVSFVVWKYDYTHKEWGKRDYTQVSTQEWQGGKIIKETFVYAN